MQFPQVRILGMDGSGKTTICETLEAIDDRVITFGSTPRFAYRWLATYGVGRADSVTPAQIDIRQHVFGKMNEYESKLYNGLCAERPVVGVRGRADTYISAQSLRGKPMPRDINVLFPKELRPDALVVLSAPLRVIEQRIDSRGERKSGANSMTYHLRTQEMYDELATIASKVMPVLYFDTSKVCNTPLHIAGQVKATINEIANAKARKY